VEIALIFRFFASFSRQQKPAGGVAVLPVKEKEPKQKDEVVNGELALITRGNELMGFSFDCV
jgi:hypothetical protein